MSGKWENENIHATRRRGRGNSVEREYKGKRNIFHKVLQVPHCTILSSSASTFNLARVFLGKVSGGGNKGKIKIDGMQRKAD